MVIRFVIPCACNILHLAFYSRIYKLCIKKLNSHQIKCSGNILLNFINRHHVIYIASQHHHLHQGNILS